MEAFIPISTALLGAITGAVITYLLGLKKTAIETRMVAGAKLRAAFAPEIAKYNLMSDQELSSYEGGMRAREMLKEALPKHAAAIEEYRCFIRPEARMVYRQMWENYFKPPWARCINFDDYVGNDGRVLLKKRIDAIFKFTEE